MFKNSKEIDIFYQTINDFIDQKIHQIPTCKIVRIDKVCDRNKVDVIDLCWSYIHDPEIEERKKPIIINDVSVLFPQSIDFHLQHPIQKGDDGLLFIIDRDTSYYQAKKEWNPNGGIRSKRSADAFFIPLLTPTKEDQQKNPEKLHLRYLDFHLESDGDVFALRNQVSSLKKELEKVYDTIDKLNNAVTNLALGMNAMIYVNTAGAPTPLNNVPVYDPSNSVSSKIQKNKQDITSFTKESMD